MARIDEDLDRLRALVADGALCDGSDLVGIEMEYHLIDGTGRPVPHNETLLTALADGPYDLQTELARFNIELNLPPVALTDAPLATLRAGIDGARELLSSTVPGTSAVCIGTLPTLEHGDVRAGAISARSRYHQLDERIMAARGGAITVDIDGTDAGGEHLAVTLHTVMLEAAATSLQVHLDLAADAFVPTWNVAQAVAALQVAIGANAPILLGRALWHETRVPLFEQLIDMRSPTQRDRTSQDALPPRVWFGDRWIDHPTDLFAENLVHFRTALLEDELGVDDPLDLSALVRHNGTVWRWNRPVYSAASGRPTLRIENRVLSAPPSSGDAAADIALFVGLVTGLRAEAQRLTSTMRFTDADANFRAAARHGMRAPLRWPGRADTMTAAELLTDGLLDVAAAGLASLGVPDAESGPALDVIAGRASTGRNGAAWQLATLSAEEERHDRPTALRRMLLRYRDLQVEGEPVHRWPWPMTGRAGTGA
jgi:hypothetical protein